MSKKYTFNSFLKNRKTFSLFIESFSQALGWVYSIRVPPIKIAMTIRLGYIIKSANVLIKKIKVTASNSLIKFETDLNNATVYVKKIKITATRWSERISERATLYVKRFKITAVVHTLLRIVSTFVPVKIKKIKIESTPILADFFLLGEHDDKYLSAMDTEWLSDLDYVLI